MELLHNPGEVILQRYKIIDTLGQGGSGITYLAQDLENDDQLAVKSLSLSRMTDWKMLELFEREAQVLAQINHPGIPRYLDYFYTDSSENRSFYIAQQLAAGKSLQTLIENNFRISEAQVQQIATQILEILVYLHGQTPPIIHRDIKPQNIIYNENGRVFLVDFGAVQNAYYTTFMRGSTVVGTYGYMAPEQFRVQAEPATDLYALGATLLHLISHRSPSDFPYDGLKISFRSYLEVSQPFVDWLEKLLEPDIEDRFSSAEVALAELKNLNSSPSRIRNYNWVWKIGALGIASAMIITTAINYKWALLNLFGFALPESICTNPATLRTFLDQTNNPNAKVNNLNLDLKTHAAKSHSLLSCATKKGHFGNVKLLIDRGANVHQKYRKNQNILHLAMEQSTQQPSQQIIKLLLQKGVDINGQDDYGRTPLHDLIKNSRYISSVIVEDVFNSGADVNIQDNNGNTPLHYLMTHDTDMIPYVVNQLLNKGANVNIQNNDGNTVLHSLINNHLTFSLGLVRYILNSDANVNIKNKLNKTPLHLLLIRSKSQRNSDFIYEVTKMLVEQGGKASIQAQDGDGNTALHLLLQGNYNSQSWFSLIAYLIKNGADVNVKNVNGNIPLHNLVGNVYFSSTATINPEYSYKYINLMPKAVELLINQGSDVDAKNKYGETPLYRLIKSRQVVDEINFAMVKMLIAKGANVKTTNINSETLFHAFVQNLIAGSSNYSKDPYFYNTQIANLLYRKGVDFQTKNRFGQTPLKMAEFSPHAQEYLNYLFSSLEKGKTVN